ncbi:uncharacterized protein LOC142487798 [Ascaphus truei]|uniref:uncharacterized protein LOC142487798 n=1 Tax=Ascaphus truei TaxID=8439 RepID=UPI003F59EA54
MGAQLQGEGLALLAPSSRVGLPGRGLGGPVGTGEGGQQVSHPDFPITLAEPQGVSRFRAPPLLPGYGLEVSGAVAQLAHPQITCQPGAKAGASAPVPLGSPPVMGRQCQGDGLTQVSLGSRLGIAREKQSEGRLQVGSQHQVSVGEEGQVVAGEGKQQVWQLELPLALVEPQGVSQISNPLLQPGYGLGVSWAVAGLWHPRDTCQPRAKAVASGEVPLSSSLVRERQGQEGRCTQVVPVSGLGLPRGERSEGGLQGGKQQESSAGAEVLGLGEARQGDTVEKGEIGGQWGVRQLAESRNGLGRQEVPCSDWPGVTPLTDSPGFPEVGLWGGRQPGAVARARGVQQRVLSPGQPRVATGRKGSTVEGRGVMLALAAVGVAGACFLAFSCERAGT